MTFGVDDVLRDIIEPRHEKDARRTVLLTTDGGYIGVVMRMVETLRQHYAEVDVVIAIHACAAGSILAKPQVPSAMGQMVPALGYVIQWECLPETTQDNGITPPEIQLMVAGLD